tara:strand:- start:316 stop:444 length:129 start_codon:yes stop_codon:yes gene_type:complete
VDIVVGTPGKLLRFTPYLQDAQKDEEMKELQLLVHEGEHQGS